MRSLIATLALLSVPAAAAAGCGCPKFACHDGDACDLVEDKYDIAEHHIEGRQSVGFDVDGMRYELVHFEYGQAQDCPAGCFFSHYCGFVFGGEEYPTWYAFYLTEEQLFDPTLFCAVAPEPDGAAEVSWNGSCDMPGWSLPVFADAAFRDWVEHPDDVNDELRWCRNGLAYGYTSGVLPRDS
jgi:hypothetical protein